jgi:predicted enzyme related to lactoylglutathione lyase
MVRTERGAPSRRVAGILLASLAALVYAVAAASPLGPDGEPGRIRAGKFVWFDLLTDDPAGARAFYGAVLGWRFRSVEGAPGSYSVIEQASGKVGGLLRQARPPGAPIGSRWLALISVADPVHAAQRVRESGGRIVLPPAALPDRGMHAVFRDPQGALFGVLAASGGDPPDTPVADGEVFWLDLFTTEPATAAAFYAGVIGYEVSRSETADGRQRWVLAADKIARAGIVSLPRGTAGPGWLPYILVADVAGTLARVREAGGRVVVAPRADLLRGNVAVIADPNGGVVGIVDWAAAASKTSP